MAPTSASCGSSDGAPSASTRVIGELVNGSPTSVAACAELLNQSDVAVIQHEYGIYGGVDGDEVVDIIDGLRVPSIVIAHTILKDPTPHQRSVLEAVAALADQVVVMSEAASERLCAWLRRRPPQSHHHPARRDGPDQRRRAAARSTDAVDLGSAGPGQGHRAGDRGDGVAARTCQAGRGTWLPAERIRRCWPPMARRTATRRIEQARRSGVADSVFFDAGYRSVAMLTALVQSAAVVVLPYDSTDQVTSGVLVDAIASGRPVVATAFPHAVELLGSGAGIVVAHDDPDALASALRRVLTAAAARRRDGGRGPPIGPDDGLAGRRRARISKLAHRLLAQRRALV